MKKIGVLLLVIIGLTLIGCSGSDTYRGNWKGMTPNGEKVEIVFEAKKLTLSDDSKKSVTHNYSQNSVNIVNSIETYGIKLDDGRGYQINFPIANDESIGLIKDENNNVLYSISRKEYINPKDIYKLK
ncbi:hypothetical protein [Flavobacterium luminosum]|uniref:Lipoprotein n=1 Tax=Flavobacterium luminosum TaxID=2949086 RepID=A0ABT0TRT5_9FLAO|nr:hypothetical protein [Flavobacterium sp. HXWNR70]MCL9809789.1 hypothetical protein [Flavobacterium sp. HXWNR70]